MNDGIDGNAGGGALLNDGNNGNDGNDGSDGYHIYEGAGHGFLRQQSGAEGANLKAAELAWPATLAFFREHLK